MKRLRLLLTTVLLLALAVPGRSCGPFFAEALFVLPTRPDIPYAEFARGKLGVPQRGWRLAHLIVAYDWLSGRGLNDAEQRGALEADLSLYPAFYGGGGGRATTETAPAPGLKAWMDTRHAAELAGLAQPLPDGQAAALGSDRHVPGANYESFANCLDDAFANAASTLTDRRAAHADDGEALKDWIAGQDAVFTNCNGEGDIKPAATQAGAPAWLLADRAYQVAAAKFYSLDYKGAMADFRAIAGKASSPRQGMARLAAARAMIRLAVVGDLSDLPQALHTSRSPGGGSNYQLEEQFTKDLAAKRPARLAEARTALNAMVADPALKSIQPSARRLLDFVALRLDPGAQAAELARRVAGTAHARDPASFRQAVIDLRYLRAAAWPGSPDVAADPLLRWVLAFGEQGDVAAYGQTVAKSPAVPDAFAAWQQTHTAPLLLAALAAAKPGDAAAAELIRAAESVPHDAPAWLPVTYHRLRLSAASPASRAELERLLPALDTSGSRSTANLLTALKQRSAPTLRTFLADAGTLPAGVTFDPDGDEASTPDPKPQGAGLCEAKSASEAGTLLFDEVAATVLNTRLPVALMADAAESPALAPNLRFQIAQAAWTRAVLLRRPEIARRLSPVLVGCYAAWQPVLQRYDEATTATDREANGLLALMRFASTEPIVRAGSQRPEGFATYSPYRDNWWTGNKTDKPVEATLAVRFFGADQITRADLPDPPFITAADRAAAEREVAELRELPCSSDFFARSALDWYKAHPADPRTPDILGYAERVVRNSCRTDATKELNHQLFVAVQTRFPGSEWATRYKTWE